MTIRGRYRLAASVLLAAMGTACGGGGAESSTAHPRAPETRVSVAPRSVPLPATTTTRPVRAKADVPVEPPNVVDHGMDVTAIAGSLLRYGRWLEGYHLDAALVERAYQPGSPPALVVSREIAMLRAAHRHFVEVDSAPFEFEIITLDPNVVSFRLTEHLARRVLVDATGRVFGGQPAATEHYVISIMRSFSDRPWRLNLVERVGPKIEVQL